MPLFAEAAEEKAARSYRLPLVRQAPCGHGSVDGWPAEVKFILSAIDAARGPHADRRTAERTNYHVVAELRLYSDGADAVPWTLYCRDVTSRSMGFITRSCLPLGHGGKLFLRGPRGEELSIDCSIRRCKLAVNGWYEGSVSFNREQWPLDASNFPQSA